MLVMLRIDFREALTALEIRDPSLKVCKEIGSNSGLYVTFDQPQHPALDGRPGHRNRQRIGNGKHKNWYINYQLEETHVSRPTVVGRISSKDKPWIKSRVYKHKSLNGTC